VAPDVPRARAGEAAGTSAEGNVRGAYLDALAALQERGELDSPEVQKHTAALAEAAEKIEKWHEERLAREEREQRMNRPVMPVAARVAAPPVTVADFDGNPWDELRDEFEEFLDEIEPEEEAGEE
jgi:hypothetical protein